MMNAELKTDGAGQRNARKTKSAAKKANLQSKIKTKKKRKRERVK